MMPLLQRVFGAAGETYALNIAQIMHMLILAGFVPWYIGLEAYGFFAAMIAMPGVVQSSFEAFSVAVLARYGRRDMLTASIHFVIVPIGLIFSLIFFIFFDTFIAFLASAMTFLLFLRSYAFSIAVSSGILTRKIVQSEGIILIVYVAVILICAGFGLNDKALPMLMVSIASLISAWYLLRTSHTTISLLPARVDKDKPRLPFGFAARAASGRIFEDGLLSLSPLILATFISPVVAGQFRIVVSAVKAAYKLFPFRYEVTLRDVATGRLGFFPLVMASTIFTVGFLLIAIVAYIVLRPEGFGWILVLVGSAGATVSSLSLFPAICSIDRHLLFICIGALFTMFALTSLYGIIGFAIGFSLVSYAVMIRSLIAVYYQTLGGGTS